MLPADLVPADCPWPVLLGLDPGTRATGYGAIVQAPGGPRLVACGVLQAPARARVPARLARIAAELEKLLAVLRPRLVVVEGAFAARNARSALRLGEARGVIIAGAAASGAEVVELAPAAAKKALVGHGGASKEQVAGMVATILGTGPLDVPHDATDALALVLAHTRRAGVRGVATGGRWSGESAATAGDSGGVP